MLQSMGSQRAGHDLTTEQQEHTPLGSQESTERKLTAGAGVGQGVVTDDPGKAWSTWGEA